MNMLKILSSKPDTIPAATAMYLAGLGEAKGMQNLHVRQSPQVLKVLREHALIESAVSSNRIEGVEIENSRIGTIMFGRPRLKDRNEEELRGYRDALNRIHLNEKKEPVSEKTVKELHQLISGEIWDAGIYKEKQGDIIQRFPDGRERIRFKTVSPKKTPECMKKLIALGEQAIREQWTHPLISIAAFNLDFLCIHPFRDGNGRVSRLLTLLVLY